MVTVCLTAIILMKKYGNDTVMYSTYTSSNQETRRNWTKNINSIKEKRIVILALYLIFNQKNYLTCFPLIISNIRTKKKNIATKTCKS